MDRPMSERAPAWRNPERKMGREDENPDDGRVVVFCDALGDNGVLRPESIPILPPPLAMPPPISSFDVASTTIFIAGCACADLADVLLLFASFGLACRHSFHSA